MDKYECTACGYIYDPAENNNVSFPELAEDWTCPLCGVGKEEFQKVMVYDQKSLVDMKETN